MMERRTKRSTSCCRCHTWILVALVSLVIYVNRLGSQRLSPISWSTTSASIASDYAGDDNDDDDQLYHDDGNHSQLLNETADTEILVSEPVIRPNYIEPAIISSTSLLLQKFDPSIRPLWTCSNAHKNRHGTKLVFVHVYKTAGSTFRLLFLNYARHCKFGITIVAHCSELSTKSISVNGTTDWRNRDGSKCRHKARNRKGRTISETALTKKSLQDHVDIAIGHLPLGVQWGQQQQQLHKDNTIQYICFVRSPLEKYVSGVIYANKQYKSYPATVEATVKRIQTFVRDEVKHGKYRDSYSAYLLTPWDKDQKLSTIDARTERILHNLVEYPTVMGIVEKMESSLELILHVIDEGNEVASLFQQAAGNKGSNASSVVLNKSRGVDTNEVVKVLQADSEFYPMLQLYLKYDATVYEFAIQLHDRQYERFLQQKAAVAI